MHVGLLSEKWKRENEEVCEGDSTCEENGNASAGGNRTETCREGSQNSQRGPFPGAGDQEARSLDTVTWPLMRGWLAVPSQK